MNFINKKKYTLESKEDLMKRKNNNLYQNNIIHLMSNNNNQVYQNECNYSSIFPKDYNLSSNQNLNYFKYYIDQLSYSNYNLENMNQKSFFNINLKSSNKLNVDSLNNSWIMKNKKYTLSNIKSLDFKNDLQMKTFENFNKRILYPFNYILVLDFEATCQDTSIYPPLLPEIIEFPVVLVDVKKEIIIDEFHSYVKPIKNSKLTDFCIKFTGITQNCVDDAFNLNTVLKHFSMWFEKAIPENSTCMFATDGPHDMTYFMYHSSVCEQGIHFPKLFYTWIDLKLAFSTFFNTKKMKIEEMMHCLNFNFVGKPHSGIDDARNLAQILIELLKRGCNLNNFVQTISYKC